MMQRAQRHQHKVEQAQPVLIWEVCFNWQQKWKEFEDEKGRDFYAKTYIFFQDPELVVQLLDHIY